MLKAEHTDPSIIDSGPGFLSGRGIKKLHIGLLRILERIFFK